MSTGRSIPHLQHHNHGMAQTFKVDPPISPLPSNVSASGGPFVPALPHASDAPLARTSPAHPRLRARARARDDGTTTPPDYGSDLDSDDASAAAALLDEAESAPPRPPRQPASRQTAMRIPRRLRRLPPPLLRGSAAAGLSGLTPRPRTSWPVSVSPASFAFQPRSD
jgi:hypothetical protein